MYDWNGDLGKFHKYVDHFARGVLLSQLWYQYSLAALKDDNGVRLVDNGERYCFVVDDRITLRIKHLNERFQTRNYRTRRAVAWDAQLPFPGIPNLVKLDFGYRLDLTGTKVTSAIIMLNNNKESVWRFQIWGAPVSEFAAAPRDQWGNTVYAHVDLSQMVLP